MITTAGPKPGDRSEPLRLRRTAAAGVIACVTPLSMATAIAPARSVPPSTCPAPPAPRSGTVVLTQADSGRPIVIRAGTIVTVNLSACDGSGPYADPWGRVAMADGNVAALSIAVRHPGPATVTGTFTIPAGAGTIAVLDQVNGKLPPGAGSRALGYVENISVPPDRCQLPAPLAESVCQP